MLHVKKGHKTKEVPISQATLAQQGVHNPNAFSSRRHQKDIYESGFGANRRCVCSILSQTTKKLFQLS